MLPKLTTSLSVVEHININKIKSYTLALYINCENNLIYCFTHDSHVFFKDIMLVKKVLKYVVKYWVKLWQEFNKCNIMYFKNRIKTIFQIYGDDIVVTDNFYKEIWGMIVDIRKEVMKLI